MTLEGHYVCFSGFSEDPNNDENENASSSGIVGEAGVNKTWSLQALRGIAESLGAVVQTQITRRTTVLVARQGLTRKRLVAEQHRIPVVSPRWLESHGCLAYADAKVAPLFGYIFSATQMSADEEKALTTIIERNGGVFDRTLTDRTSMLFVPPSWIKQWQQRMQGRSSTGPPPVLPEKVRFAWATEIPIVEFPRFLSMAALGAGGSDWGNSGGVVGGVSSSGGARADFDTIARLCALPISVAGGAVPHTQRDEVPVKHVGKESEEDEEEKEGETIGDIRHTRKRQHNDDDDDDSDGGERWRKKVCILHDESEEVIKRVVNDEFPGSHHEERSVSSKQHHIQHPKTEVVGVLDPALVKDERLLSLFPSDAAVSIPPNNLRRTTRSMSCENPNSVTNNNNNNNNMIFNGCFVSHSRPFLQVALLGCTARELMDCIHMVVRCRFMRTPVVTPFTDVVVVGSKYMHGTMENVHGTDGKRAPPQISLRQQEKHQQESQLLSRLRDHLALNYGVPLERIVGVKWLLACYQHMMVRHVPSIKSNSRVSFFPSPLSLSEIPPTEKFKIQLPSTVFLFDVPQPQLQEHEEKKEAANPPSPPSLSRQRRKKTQQQQQQVPCLSAHNPPAPRESGGHEAVVNPTQDQYEVEIHLAARRVQDLLALLNNNGNNNNADAIEEGSASLLTCLFCFVEKEFSRIDMAVVRALVKHGKGAWLKKNRDEWIKLLKRTAAPEGNQMLSTGDGELVTLVRRHSIIRKRLCRMQTEDCGPEDISVRASILFDGGRRDRKLSSVSAAQQKTTLAFYVVPHGDQRPSESLLRSEGRQGTTLPRHPLRYLPAVTQDYILCCLAADRLLHPGKCFLFNRPVPTEAERLTRRQWRSESGKPLTVSPWLGPRRHEKAPLVGISVYFLCAMRDDVSPAAVALRRVLVSCLTAAVSDLGGHGTEMLLQEAVTHVVVVDVASVFESEFLAADVAMDGSLTWCKIEEREEQERVDLLSRKSEWSHAMQDQLPDDLVESVLKKQISLVGIEWLHSSVAWGVFLDEAPYTLPVTSKKDSSLHPPGMTHYDERSVVALSTVTPPISPHQRRCVALTDVTLLPFENTAHTTAVTSANGLPTVHTMSPQISSGYQFDFSTPAGTPVHPRMPRDERSEGGNTASAKRQSCPRPTLRTPRKQRVSVPRTISPATVLVNAQPSQQQQQLLQPSPSSVSRPVEVIASSSESDIDEMRETATPPRNSDFMAVEKYACTPVRKTCILGEDNDYNSNSNTNNNNSDNEVNRNAAQRSGMRFSSHLPVVECNSVTMAVPQQWNPYENNNSRDGSQQLRTPQPRALSFKDSSDASLSSQCPGGLTTTTTAITTTSTALRVHILHDVPDRDRLITICSKLSDSAFSYSDSINNDKNRSDNPNGMSVEFDSFRQQHLPRQNNMIRGMVTHLKIVSPSVRDADVLVTHKLSQRESILAAIAAGLWVVTPKALYDSAACQSFLPLRDLSVYEWCPELLPPESPSSSIKLAQQCRSRRQERHANGTRLFDGQCFVFVSPNTSVGLARGRSMRAVIEIGGGVVMCAACAYGDSVCGGGGGDGAKDSSNHGLPTGMTAEPVLLSSPSALVDIVASQIRGREAECRNADDSDAYAGMRKFNAMNPKELIVLLDNFAQGGAATKEWLQDTVDAFRHAESSFLKAKKEAVARRMQQRRQDECRSPQAQPLDFTRVGSEMKDGELSRNIKAIWPSTTTTTTKRSIPHVGEFVPTPQVHKRENEKNISVCGMPFVEVVRVFTSDWVALAVQKRRKTPLCVVNIPS